MTGEPPATALALIPDVPEFCRSLTLVSVAVFTREGDLLDANPAFLSLLGDETVVDAHPNVEGVFVSPRFDEIVGSPSAEPGTLVYRGLLDLGALDADPSRFVGYLYDYGCRLFLVAERTAMPELA